MLCELHVHSALSACADNTMSPRRIVTAARERNIELLAITDHNASSHVSLTLEYAQRFGMLLLPGMEVTSREEVHLLAFFPTLDALDDFQELVDAHLPREINIPEIFGPQVLYDANDKIVDLDTRMRQVGASLSIPQLVEAIHAREGAAIPAHIDRPRHGLIAQLGFVDPGAGYDALELTWHAWKRDKHCPGERIEGYPLVTGSDAHFLEDIGQGLLELPGAISTPENLVELLDRL